MNDELQTIIEELEKFKRYDQPSPDEIDDWELIVEMDTNRSTWVPKKLIEKYHQIRFGDWLSQL